MTALTTGNIPEVARALYVSSLTHALLAVVSACSCMTVLGSFTNSMAAMKWLGCVEETSTNDPYGSTKRRIQIRAIGLSSPTIFMLSAIILLLSGLGKVVSESGKGPSLAAFIVSCTIGTVLVLLLQLSHSI